MKKILLLILAILPFFGIEQTGFALSYNGVPQYAYPSFVKDGVLNNSALVAQTPCAYFSQAWGCSNFQPNNPWFFSTSRSVYYYHNPWTLWFWENYKSAQQSIIELDLTNTPSGSGARLLDGWCQASGYCFDLYMSGADLKYRLWYVNSTEPNFIYQHTWSIPQLAWEWKDVNFGGYQSKHVVIWFRQYFYTYNNLVGSKAFLQKISMQRITDTSRSSYVDFTQSGSIDGVLMTNTFSPQDFDGVPFFFNYSNQNSFWNKVNSYVTSYPSTKASFPYYRDTIEVTYSPGGYYPYYGNILTFPNAYYYAFGDLTTQIRSSSGASDSWNYNDDNFLSSFYDIDNALANFYVGTNTNIYGSQWNWSNGWDTGWGGTGGWSGSTTTDFYANCSGWTDVGCYVKGTGEQIAYNISTLFSPITSALNTFTSIFSTDTYNNSISASGSLFEISNTWLLAQDYTPLGNGLCKNIPTQNLSSDIFKVNYQTVENPIGRFFAWILDKVANVVNVILGSIRAVFMPINPPLDTDKVCYFQKEITIDYQKFIPTTNQIHNSYVPDQYNPNPAYSRGDKTLFDYVAILLIVSISLPMVLSLFNVARGGLVHISENANSSPFIFVYRKIFLMVFIPPLILLVVSYFSGWSVAEFMSMLSNSLVIVPSYFLTRETIIYGFNTIWFLSLLNIYLFAYKLIQ